MLNHVVCPCLQCQHVACRCHCGAAVFLCKHRVMVVTAVLHLAPAHVTRQTTHAAVAHNQLQRCRHASHRLCCCLNTLQALCPVVSVFIQGHYQLMYLWQCEPISSQLALFPGPHNVCQSALHQLQDSLHLPEHRTVRLQGVQRLRMQQKRLLNNTADVR